MIEHEWKFFLAIYLTLVGLRFTQEMGKMRGSEREGWSMLVTRGFVTLMLWGGYRLWVWALA